jgi:hypothetical protein
MVLKDVYEMELELFFRRHHSTEEIQTASSSFWFSSPWRCVRKYASTDRIFQRSARDLLKQCQRMDQIDLVRGHHVVELRTAFGSWSRPG